MFVSFGNSTKYSSQKQLNIAESILKIIGTKSTRTCALKGVADFLYKNCALNKWFAGQLIVDVYLVMCDFRSKRN